MTADFLFDAKVLDHLVAATRGPFLVCDRDGGILYAAPAAREFLNIDTGPNEHGALRGLQLDEQVRDRLLAAVADIYRQPSPGPSVRDTLVDPHYALRPLRNAEDRVIGAILEVVEDVRAGNDPPPDENDFKYQNLVEASSQGIIVHRNDRVLYVNQAAFEVLGYDSAEEMRRLESIDAYVHPDDRSSTRAYRESRGRGEWAPDDYDFRALRKDGTVVWINCRPTIIDWGGASAFQVTFFDVTERKRALEAMARADARFRELLEQAAVGILIRRGDRSVFANQAVAQMFGHEHPQDVMDVGIVGLREAEAGRERARRHRLGSSDADPSSTYLEFEGRRQDGRKVWLGCWGQPVTWDEEPALLSILVDISERKRLEEELRHVQRMDAVGRMAGGLAHEVNNILAVVLGHLDVTRQALIDGDVPTEQLEKAVQSVTHGTALAQRVLAMSEQEHQTLRAIDINQTATSIVGLLTGMLGQKIAIETKLAEQVWPVKTDSHEGEAALLNLALNSRDAMAHGGVVSVSTENVVVERAQASQHEDVEPGDYVLISVADDGPGMTPETAARAFEPFFTTKPRGKGTGLGLSMVHGFAARSGGFAELNSRPGSGTRVNLYLPRAHG